jgi:F0F1-type ATP synthase assembly protein I
MPFIVKLLVSNLIIISCVLLGRRFPSLAGLIATMPITTLIVLLWLHSDNQGDSRLLTPFVGGVFWGIIPTLLFFAAAWLVGACVHRALLK